MTVLHEMRAIFNRKCTMFECILNIGRLLHAPLCDANRDSFVQNRHERQIPNRLLANNASRGAFRVFARRRDGVCAASDFH